jgi:hypothetical protein
VAHSKVLFYQWKNEPPCRDELCHDLAFTKSGQEPKIYVKQQGPSASGKHRFRGRSPMAHTFACLRIAALVSKNGARFATGSGGLTPGRMGFAPNGRCAKFHGGIAVSNSLRPTGPGRTVFPIRLTTPCRRANLALSQASLPGSRGDVLCALCHRLEFRDGVLC